MSSFQADAEATAAQAGTGIGTGAGTGVGSESAAPTWGGAHPVNIRISLPFGFFRCYITLVAGVERRSSQRLDSERRRHPIRTFGNLLVLSLLGGVVGLALLALLQIAGMSLFAHNEMITLTQ